MFGKRNGHLHPAMRILFAPFLLPLAAWRRTRRDPDPHDLIISGVRLGRLVSSRRAARLIENGVTAVLDMTCEHSEAPPFLGVEYCNIQVLDLTPPSVEELCAATRFVLEHVNEGEVYIHCAQGFGRSAMVATACVLAMEGDLGVDEASQQVERARDSVRLRAPALQRRLEEFRTRWRRG